MLCCVCCHGSQSGHVCQEFQCVYSDYTHVCTSTSASTRISVSSHALLDDSDEDCLCTAV